MTTQSDSVTGKIVVDVTVDTPTVYANHVEIAINQHEIAMYIARLPTKPGRDQMAEITETGEVVVEPEFQVLLPPTLIDGMISAFQITKEKYEATYGPIREIKE